MKDYLSFSSHICVSCLIFLHLSVVLFTMCRGGEGSLSRGISVQGGRSLSRRPLPPTAIRLCAGGTHPTGIQSCILWFQQVDTGLQELLIWPPPTAFHLVALFVLGWRSGTGMFSFSSPVCVSGWRSGTGMFSFSSPVCVSGWRSGTGMFSFSSPVCVSGWRSGTGMFSFSSPVCVSGWRSGTGMFSFSSPVCVSGWRSGTSTWRRTRGGSPRTCCSNTPSRASRTWRAPSSAASWSSPSPSAERSSTSTATSTLGCSPNRKWVHSSSSLTSGVVVF